MQKETNEPGARPTEQGQSGPPAPVPFDEKTWLVRLRELNPWAAGLDIYEGNKAFVTARKADCLRRYEAGRATWNGWANAMLALQRDAKAAGLWKNARDTLYSVGTNSATAMHLACSATDFRKHDFVTDADFSEFDFPGATDFTELSIGTKDNPSRALFDDAQFYDLADFRSTRFYGDADFYRTQFYSQVLCNQALFSGDVALYWAHFHRDADFSATQFKKFADFHESTFHDAARFERVQFCDGVGFHAAQFHDNAQFSLTHFRGNADFRDTLFRAHAGFYKTQFKKGAAFSGARFGRSQGEVADFAQATFKGPVTFDEAEFAADAILTSIHSKVAFSLACTKFRRTPDFIEATFHQAPRLDDCELIDPITESQLFDEAEDAQVYPSDPRPPGLLRCFALARDKHEHARLRKLRAMAADGRDHENEILFNAYEIAARRFWVDKPSSARFWLGWLYGFVSGYGRSIARPLVAWAIMILAFWGLFFFTTTDLPTLGHGEHCHPAYEATLLPDELQDQRGRMFGGPGGQSLALALRNAIVLDRSEPATSRRMFGCLYGMTGKEASALPVIPPAVNLLSAIQSVLSAVLLFLTGLGIRNMFRMKGS